MSFQDTVKCSFLEVLEILRELSVCKFDIPIIDCNDIKNTTKIKNNFKTKCKQSHEECYGIYIVWCGCGIYDKKDKVLYIGMSGKLDGNLYKGQHVIKRIPNTKNGYESAIEWCEEEIKPYCNKNLYIEVLCLDTTRKHLNIITPECAEALLLRAHIVDYGDLPPANSIYKSVRKKCNCK